MKLAKSISLFFVCSVISFGGGMLYESQRTQQEPQTEIPVETQMPQETPTIIQEEPMVEAAVREEKLNADTLYIIKERNMATEDVVRTSTKLPAKYIGMTMEQFLESLKDYVANPPLKELERGFVNAELLTFSPKQVEVQMDYQYIQPTGSFYIVIYDNRVLVMLEDKKTVFQETEIDLSELPEEVQQDILHGLFIPNQESLYDFLENYTS